MMSQFVTSTIIIHESWPEDQYQLIIFNTWIRFTGPNNQIQPLHNSDMQPEKYGETPYRFVVIVTFMLACLFSFLPSTNFAAITSLVEKRFEISTVLVSLNYVLVPIARCTLMLPINWLITKKGIRFSFIFSALCMITGVWLRITLSKDNPYVCLIGSFLTGVSAMILTNSISKVAVEWFRAEILSFVTFPCVLIIVVSQTLSLLIPGLFLSSSSSAEDIISFLKLVAIIVTGPNLLLIIVFTIRDKPQISPSKTAKAQKSIIKQSYFKVIKRLFKNKNYLLIILVICLTSGPINPFQSSLNKTLIGLGFSQPSHIITVSAISLLASGLIGNLVYAVWLKKTNKFRVISIVMNCANFLGFALVNFGLIAGYGQDWQIGLMASLFGFNVGAHNPFFYVYATQIAFPIDQASILGYLAGILQLFGFALSMLYVILVDETRSNSIMLNSIAVGMMFVGFLLTVFIKEDLRKDRFQEEKQYHEPLIQDQTEQKEEYAQKAKPVFYT